MMKKALLGAVAACLLLAGPVTAKEGIYVGVFRPSSRLSGYSVQSDRMSSGAGWGVRAGLGFNRYVAIEGNYTATKHDVTGGSSVDLNSLAGDLKLSFPLTSLDRAQVMSLEWYLLFGYDRFELSGGGTTVKSNGFQLGFGIELYLFKEMSIQGGWTDSRVSFDTTPVRTDDHVITVDFGIIYHFI